jgi:hypothetical protein
MQPLNFDGANVVFGANQPEYQPLPAEMRLGHSSEIVTCWELSPEELERVQETGKIWLSLLTFGQPLQPVLVSVDKPEPYDSE